MTEPLKPRDPIMEIVRRARRCARCGHLEVNHTHDAPDAAPEAYLGSCWTCGDDCPRFQEPTEIGL